MRQPGVLRLAVGEEIVDGSIHQVLACGHTLLAILDSDGLWKSEARLCSPCREQIRTGERPNFLLIEEETMEAIKRGGWGLLEQEKADLFWDAENVWQVLRYDRRRFK